MNARLERKLRTLGAIIVVSALAGLAINLTQSQASLTSMMVGAVYGLLMSLSIGIVELFVLDGPMRSWLGGLSFTASLIVRSAIYAVIIMLIQAFQSGEVIVGLPRDTSGQHFWFGFIYSALISVVANLGFGIANIIGPRALRNFITGRYHSPVEENRFVLFVDIAGSTGLAEQLGGVGIHRFLDRTFRLLTLAVVDYRGEVLNYVGDEVIVTWPEDVGAVDCRPLRCFMAMRDELARCIAPVRARIRRGAEDSRQPAFRAGDRRRDRRRQARHRVQRRRHEYRGTARRTQPQRGWRLSGVARGDGTVQLGAAVCGSRSRAAADSRPRRWHRRGRHRRAGPVDLTDPLTPPASASPRNPSRGFGIGHICQSGV